MAVDPLWDDVVVLCHFNGTENSQIFRNDADSTADIEELGGDIKLKTAQKLFGSASAYIPGDDGALDTLLIQSLPSGGLGTAWCIEMAVYLESVGPTPEDPFSDPPAGVDLFTAYLDGFAETSYLNLTSYDFGYGPRLFATYYDEVAEEPKTLPPLEELVGEYEPLELGVWYRGCLDYDGTTIRLFLDGTLLASAALASQDFPNDVWTAINSYSADDKAYFDELRITRASRRTANYTVDAEPFYSAGKGDGEAVLALTASGVGAEIVARAGSATVEVTAAAVGRGLPYGEATGAVSAAAVAAPIQARPGTATVSVTATGRAPSPAVAEAAIEITGAGIGQSPRVFAIQIDHVLYVGVGVPISIGLASSVSTVSLPIRLGQYIKTVTLPIRITTPVAVSTITLPIRIYGDLSDQIEGGSTDWGGVVWRPKVVIDGADISAKLVGAIEIETEEMASPIARLSFLPTVGSLDPLGFVGKPITIQWERYTAGLLDQTALRFTGVVSDPTWDADQRMMSIDATGDMQARYDRMTKEEIATVLAGLSPRFSKHIFGDEADLSGWEYAEALISTTDGVLWMDVAGTLKATTTLAAVTADYTYDESLILSGSLADSPQWPSRQEMVNKIELAIEYRHKRKRERHISVQFKSEYLDSPSYYLSGYLGGWPLPQKSQVESAANGGGWSVIGDIEYVAVWPSGVYPTWGDTGSSIPGMGWSNNEAITKDFCIGASWTAARRWLQTVGEVATITVNASESQEVVGVLADAESYGIEDPTDDETWETSTEYTDYVGGAIIMLNGVDRKVELDELRAEFEDAQETAIAKARGDILRAHRGTTVTFQTGFAPSLGLHATVAVDTTYLQCQGKVRRLVDYWDIDTGDCITTVDIALYRHNGSGLTTDTEIAPVDEVEDPDETTPTKVITMGMYIGGSETRPPWSTVKDKSGYFVNLPFDATWGSATVLGQWQRDPRNPLVKLRTYEEGMRIKYPPIDAEYVDPQTAAATAAIEVAVPEDPLVIVSG